LITEFVVEEEVADSPGLVEIFFSDAVDFIF